MKFSLVALLPLVGFAAAQSFTDLPTCAQGCATSLLTSSGCNPIDIKCICSNKNFISDISCCISKACPQSDQQAAVNFATGLCQANGGVSVPTSASCAATASATGSSNSTATSASATTTKTSTSTSASASATKNAAAKASTGGFAVVIAGLLALV